MIEKEGGKDAEEASARLKKALSKWTPVKRRERAQLKDSPSVRFRTVGLQTPKTAALISPSAIERGLISSSGSEKRSWI